MCIAAISPNNIYDRDQSDNLACDSVHIVLGMADIPASAPFKLITDPMNDRIVIRFRSPTTRIVQVKMLDMSGRLHDLTTLSPGLSNYSFNTAGLAAGVYALDIIARLLAAGRQNGLNDAGLGPAANGRVVYRCVIVAPSRIAVHSSPAPIFAPRAVKDFQDVRLTS